MIKNGGIIHLIYVSFYTGLDMHSGQKRINMIELVFTVLYDNEQKRGIVLQ